MSAAPARSISSINACEYDEPPQLLLSTRMFPSGEPANAVRSWTANSMALIASEEAPDSPSFMKLRLSSDARQLTPATPPPLFPSAPAVPARCVACVAPPGCPPFGLQLTPPPVNLAPCVPAGQVI